MRDNPTEMTMTEDEKWKYENEEVEFTVTCKMKRRWGKAFLTMLRYMETCGAIGHSSDVGIFADGDGDFRPQFQVDRFEKFRPFPPLLSSYSSSRVIFDADFTPEKLDGLKTAEGQEWLDEDEKKKLQWVLKDWLEYCQQEMDFNRD